MTSPANPLTEDPAYKDSIQTLEPIDDIEAVSLAPGLKEEDFGEVPRGTHSNEFNVPRGTRLVLGHVQEGLHAGDARYFTFGVAVRAEQTGDYRCRVIWQMSWDNDRPLPAVFRYVTY